MFTPTTCQYEQQQQQQQWLEASHFSNEEVSYIVTSQLNLSLFVFYNKPEQGGKLQQHSLYEFTRPNHTQITH